MNPSAQDLARLVREMRRAQERAKNPPDRAVWGSRLVASGMERAVDALIDQILPETDERPVTWDIGADRLTVAPQQD